MSNIFSKQGKRRLNHRKIQAELLSNMKCTDICACMEYKVVKQTNTFEALKKLNKPNCNICMEEL